MMEQDVNLLEILLRLVTVRVISVTPPTVFNFSPGQLFYLPSLSSHCNSPESSFVYWTICLPS
jgi:hypothetical protein